MRSKLIHSVWVLGVLTLAVFCLSSCDRQLDVQQAYAYFVETMPVSKSISEGQTVEIRCSILSLGDFKDNQYTIRYFQTDGDGTLTYNKVRLLPNDRYLLDKKEFRLYYTSHSTERQSIDIYIEDSFKQVKKITFDFNNKQEKKDERR